MLLSVSFARYVWSPKRCIWKRKNLIWACVGKWWKLNIDGRKWVLSLNNTGFPLWVWQEAAGCGFICKTMQPCCHKLQQFSCIPSPKFSCSCMKCAPSDPASHGIISDKRPFHKTSPKFVSALFTLRTWRQGKQQQMAKTASYFHRLLITALTTAHL